MNISTFILVLTKSTEWTGEGKVETSREGCSLYLLITNQCSKYLWDSPTISKALPCKIFNSFLKKFDKFAGLWLLWTDLKSELAKNKVIQDIAKKHKYILESTAVESSFQNEIVERLHCTLENMISSMLTDAGLGNTFWADDLLHTSYAKNRLSHKAITLTPFEKLKGTKANL